jgi:membrane-bound lytic murein transglycosylase B
MPVVTSFRALFAALLRAWGVPHTPKRRDASTQVPWAMPACRMAPIAALLLSACAVIMSAPASAAPRKSAGATADKADKSDKSGLPTYANRSDAQALAEQIATQFDLDAGWTQRAIGQARQLPVIQRLVLPPPAGTPKNWAAYRSRFIEPRRIQAGVRFWRSNAPWLERAEQRFGVPAEMIVGIIGVETLYGQQLGGFRLLDALATLAIDFPAEHPRAAERTAFFRGELGHFLQQQHRSGSDPASPRGSYAGASGLPQFMPSSRTRFAIDFDGDGKINLGSSADAIGSVANYFKAFGWQSGMPTHYALRFDEARLDKEALLLPDILPTFSAEQMAQRGVVLDQAGAAHAGPLALIELQNGADAPSYVAGTENFYVVTRYNWSSYYAMAVIELGREVREALKQTPVAEETATKQATPKASAKARPKARERSPQAQSQKPRIKPSQAPKSRG